MGGGRSGPGGKVGELGLDARVQEDPGVATRVLTPEGTRGHDVWVAVLGRSNMVEMDSISPNPSLVPGGGEGAGGPESAALSAAGLSRGRGAGGGPPPGKEHRGGSPRSTLGRGREWRVPEWSEKRGNSSRARKGMWLSVRLQSQGVWPCCGDRVALRHILHSVALAAGSAERPAQVPPVPRQLHPLQRAGHGLQCSGTYRGVYRAVRRRDSELWTQVDLGREWELE